MLSSAISIAVKICIYLQLAWINVKRFFAVGTGGICRSSNVTLHPMLVKAFEFTKHILANFTRSFSDYSLPAVAARNLDIRLNRPIFSVTGTRTKYDAELVNTPFLDSNRKPTLGAIRRYWDGSVRRVAGFVTLQIQRLDAVASTFNNAFATASALGLKVIHNDIIQ